MVSITITGLERVQEINQILIDKKNYTGFLDWLANYTLDLAKLYAPRKTGVLESAGVITGEDMSRTISFNSVPYATYMENGTNYFPVDGNEKAPMARTSTSGKPCFHPFLRTAGYVAVNEIPRILDETIFNKIKK
jgi:hypothetical protein